MADEYENSESEIEVILFDFDDTLVDIFRSKVPAIIEYAKVCHGVELSEEEVAVNWGRPFHSFLSSLVGSAEIDVDAYLRISESYPLKSFPESEAILRRLAAKWRTGIVTSLSRKVLLHSLEALGWEAELFSVLQAQEDSLVHKPNPEVFLTALRRLELLSERERGKILYVGDSISDARAAQGAGLQFIGIARDETRQRAFSSEGFCWKRNLHFLENRVDRGGVSVFE